MRNDKAVYIRRSDLLRALDSEQENSIGPEDTYAGGLAAAIEIVEDCVGIETIKVKPVQRGRWVPLGGTLNVECSECKAVRSTFSQAYWDYCPNCGAKMDGGVSDEG